METECWIVVEHEAGLFRFGPYTHPDHKYHRNVVDIVRVTLPSVMVSVIETPVDEPPTLIRFGYNRPDCFIEDAGLNRCPSADVILNFMRQQDEDDLGPADPADEA